MNRVISRCMGLYHLLTGGKRIDGPHMAMRGDCTNLRGYCTDLWGYCTNLRGYCTNLRGDLDDAFITDEERSAGVALDDLVA